MSWSFFPPFFFPFLERLGLLGICWWAESACGGSGGWEWGTGDRDRPGWAVGKGLRRAVRALGAGGRRACLGNWGRAAGWSCSLLASACFEVAPTGRRWLCIPGPAKKVIWKQWPGKAGEPPMPTVHLTLLQDAENVFRNKGH